MYGDIAPVRSMPRVSIATFQPPFTSPTTRSAGVRASSKNTSQNSSPPAMLRIGRTSTPGLVRVDEQHRDPAVPALLGARPAQHVHPVGVVADGHPDLLAVDDPRVAVELGARAQRREVGPGVGLAEALAPELLGAHDRGEEALLLLRRCRAATASDRAGRARSRRPRRARRARACSIWKMTSCVEVPPRPPYCSGHEMLSHPPDASSRSHSSRMSQCASSVGLPAPRCSRNSPTR